MKSLQQNFQFCKNKIVCFMESLPYYFNKIKEFCIYIITFLKTQCKNLIAFKDMKFSLYPHEILSNAKIALNCCIALIAFTVILIVIIYFSFFLDILKFLLKTIRFIIWKIPKFLVIKITKSIIFLFSIFKCLIKKNTNNNCDNRIKKIANVNNNEIKNLNEKIELQYKLIKQL
ncbi:hypothetical protein C6B37_01355, partial [Candidatus Phytoplasma phoenicium]